MRLIKNLKEFIANFLRTPTAEELAIWELNEAKRQHLQMLTALDYSKRMVDYHQDRIKRLTAYIAKGVVNDD